ncbi:SDR family NAD(P)-dependent oxidoreductase [Actinoplanes teichomyceticus]|uniref:SDR family NAD(P)-dependent oxidoreductase n=1 Tax=Actinoplanes teichomyceticus TaxID=1867 RepID=UPI00201261A6
MAAAVDRVRTAGRGAEPGHVRADFERLADVRALAEHLLSTYPQIDVMAGNAGMPATARRRTVDGDEATLTPTIRGPFQLSNLLRDRLRRGRIVNTSARPGRNAQRRTLRRRSAHPAESPPLHRRPRGAALDGA